MSEQPRDRIRSRRRIVAIGGLLLMTVLTATACIFDKSEYQGGGRADKGATANTAPSDSTPPAPAPTPTVTDTTKPMPFDAAIPDAGAGGG